MLDLEPICLFECFVWSCFPSLCHNVIMSLLEHLLTIPPSFMVAMVIVSLLITALLLYILLFLRKANVRRQNGVLVCLQLTIPSFLPYCQDTIEKKVLLSWSTKSSKRKGKSTKSKRSTRSGKKPRSKSGRGTKSSAKWSLKMLTAHLALCCPTDNAAF